MSAPTVVLMAASAMTVRSSSFPMTPTPTFSTLQPSMPPLLINPVTCVCSASSTTASTAAACWSVPNATKLATTSSTPPLPCVRSALSKAASTALHSPLAKSVMSPMTTSLATPPVSIATSPIA